MTRYERPGPDTVTERAAARELAGRCRWCAVKLRWWQLAYCRRCARALAHNAPSPPCRPNSRFASAPDTFPN